MPAFLIPSTYMHRREISDVVQIFTRSCLSEGLAMPRWILEQDVWKDAPVQAPPNQRRLLYHAIPVDHGRLICQPDIACFLQLPTSSVVIYWEIDRSTEGRKQLREPAKSDAYHALLATNGYKRYWPDLQDDVHKFVFWICPTPERCENVRRLFQDDKIANHLRFSHRKVFNQTTNVLTTPIFQNVTGELRQILKHEST